MIVKEKDGYTLLYGAARHSEGHEFIKILLEKGLDPSMHRLYSKTLLHDAYSLNYVKCAAVLIEDSADINKTHDPSRSPIFDSIDSHSYECIDL